MERLVRRSAGHYPTDLPQHRFYCLLDAEPDHLVPRNVGSPRHAPALPDAARLRFNSDCQFSQDWQFPAGLLMPEDLLAGFALQGRIAWTRNAASGGLQPFWLSPETALDVERAKTEPWRLKHIPSQTLSLLLYAGILLADGSAAQPGDSSSDSALTRSAVHFRDQGYVPVAGLIHPFHVSALRRYYRHLLRTGNLPLGDSQACRRYVAHDEPVARFFHHQLSTVVSKIAGEPVKPSYVYFASYQEGSILEEHTDREQCEFSITMCIDYSPEPNGPSPWPIRLRTPEGLVSVYQNLGDALFYRGCEIPHFRGPLPRGHSSTSLFFHYVPQGFTGSLD